MATGQRLIFLLCIICYQLIGASSSSESPQQINRCSPKNGRLLHPVLDTCMSISLNVISRQPATPDLSPSASNAVKAIRRFYNMNPKTTVNLKDSEINSKETEIITRRPTSASTKNRITERSLTSISTTPFNEEADETSTELAATTKTATTNDYLAHSTTVATTKTETTTTDVATTTETLTYSSTTTMPECIDNLGMTNGDIPDQNIQASDTHSSYHVSGARIGGASKWSAPRDDVEPWIQADIGYKTYVSGVVTQGDAGIGQAGWITTLKVSTFSNSITDEEIFIKDEYGTILVFQANSDSNTLVTSRFPEPVYARIVRITCLTKNDRMWIMRFELLGCQITNQ